MGFCYIAMNGCSAKELEESLIDLCVAGIDIEEYFICKKQKKKKAKFCGEKDYKFLCSKLNKKTPRKRWKRKFYLSKTERI